jgi:HKD family nuclease
LKQKHKWHQKKRWRIGGGVILILTAIMLYHRVKPLPPGISYEGEIYTLAQKDVEFLYDLTYDKNGKEVYDHSIFDEVYKIIEKADDFLVLDLFLVNGYTDGSRPYPKLSEKLKQTIKEQIKKNPGLKVVFITDHINTSYRSHTANQIAPLKELGADVIYTNLNKLRDPNIIYSGIWRSAIGWFGQEGYGWLPNPMASSAPKVTARSYLKLLNVKANHRKVVITEDAGLILSANPHDASGFHSNIAFKVKGDILKDMVKAEKAVAAYSGGDENAFPTNKELDHLIKPSGAGQGPDVKAQILTESKVQDHVVKAMDEAESGDEIWIGMFYLADRDIIDAIEDAAERKVEVRLILDPNQNAFGQEKIGLPNLPIASELHNLNNKYIKVRWYDTNKEQYHSKFIYVKGKKQSIVIGGSTNYTSRNLDDYNLEENIKLSSTTESEFIQSVNDYFKRLWNNEDGNYTVEYKTYQDKLPVIKYIMYFLQKIFQVTTY